MPRQLTRTVDIVLSDAAPGGRALAEAMEDNVMSVSHTFQPYRMAGIPATAVRVARTLAVPMRAAVARIILAHERDRAYRQLSAMSDHQLQDIGVSRAEIRARVYGDRA